jgi:hypothetical protein
MNKQYCKFVLGKDLNEQQLKFINHLRKKEFNSKTNILPDPTNDDWEKVFIIYESQDTHELLAFCRLHKVNLTLKNKNIEVIGFATLIAVEKRKGYGSTILDCAKYYSVSENKQILGFCNPKLDKFYIKNGFKILNGGVEKFIYTNDSGNVVPPSYPKSIAFMYDRTGLLIKNINNSEDKIYISMSHW